MVKDFRRCALGLAVALLTGSLLALWAGETRAQQSFQVIVHPDNPTESISAQRLSWLFLRRATRWDHGADASPVDLPEGSTIRAEFTEEIHDRSVSAVKAYWTRVIYSGGGLPPPVKQSPTEVVEFVGRNAGGVGYVPSGTPLVGVKVLEVSQ